MATSLEVAACFDDFTGEGRGHPPDRGGHACLQRRVEVLLQSRDEGSPSWKEVARVVEEEEEVEEEELAQEEVVMYTKLLGIQEAPW